MSKVYRKRAVAFTINGEEVNIRPLGIGYIVQLKKLKTPIAEAITKLKPIVSQAYEEFTTAEPSPTETDPENVTASSKKKFSPLSQEAIANDIDRRTQGIEALFNIFLEEDLIEDIFRNSIEDFEKCDKGEILKKMDIPTAAEIFAHIVEVNIEGFKGLGKYWNPLKNIMDKVGVKV